MSTRIPALQIFQGENLHWYWRLRGTNGKIVAQSEGYKQRAGAIGGAVALQRIARMARIDVGTPRP